MLTAWGDESVSNTVRDPGTYILAVALTLNEHLDDLRDAVEKLRPRRAKKLHWHDDTDARHHTVLQGLATLPFESFVVIRSAPGDRLEHSRRKCLDLLLRELEQLGCAELTLESRGPADDQRDRQLLQTLRRARHPAGAIRLHHEAGPRQPLLWIADAVCGAVRRNRAGHSEFLGYIEDRTTIRECA